MKTKDFQDALTNVNDKYIEEAATYRKSAKGLRVWRGIAIAASCLLVVSLSIVLAASLFGRAGSSNNMPGKDSAGRAGGYSAETGAVTPAVPSGGTSLNDSSYSNYMDGEGYAGEDKAELAPENYEKSAEEGTYGNGSAQPVRDKDAKIIYTSTISMQSEEFDETVTKIDDMVTSSGGYYESRTISDSSGNYRTASFVIRVPADSFGDFVKNLEDTATITYQYQEAEDVSDYYYDIQSRLDTAKTKLKRLQDLLAQAEDMADIITIEDAISDTEWEIDDLQGSLNYFDSRVSYSTVSIDLREVYKVEPITTPPMTFGEKISSAFHDGLDSFTEGMGDLAIWFAESWTWLLLVIAIHAAVFLIIFLSVRKAIRRRADRN